MPDWKGKGKPEDMAISASQQYKQAGNSIVVDVLAHIYEQLFYPAPPRPRKQEQLTLFADLEDTLPALPPSAADKNEEKIFLTTFSGYDSQLMAADVLKEWHPDLVGRARDGATSTSTPVRCTTSYFRSLPSVHLVTSPRLTGTP